MGVSRDLRGILSSIEGGTAEAVGLQVENSHTGNHHEDDDFTPLETIRRFLGVIGSRSLLSSVGRPSSRIRGRVLLQKNKLSLFLTAYGIPFEYWVMLPKSNQTICDAPDRFVSLYTHSFSVANLRLPLLIFFCDVLEYFHVHVSMLNPFGYAKLTTFAVMCKTYGGEPMVELFRGFFNLYPGGQWLTFSKRQEKDFIVPSESLELLLKDNRWDKRSFKDKIPPSIHENPLYQRLGRHLVNVQTLSDPILFLAGLKPSWEHGQQHPAIFISGKEMAFRNFMYAEDDEDMSFLPHEPSPSFGTAHEEMLVIGTGNVSGRMKDRKCRMNGSTKPPMKCKLVHAGSSSRSTRQKSSPAKAKSS
ncbi:hypothetical protein Tco_0860389 [Tanacetum coccineum]|uniref:Transposase (putative) gypsy type domain-containing protein n=1 Tax=Tanacetum coccineum TaxID=301880 RepID=A0ABQ5BHW8_9ASTR